MALGVRPLLTAGDVLAGRYRLETLCGEGPLASLWRATDEILGRPVAVKLLPMTVDTGVVASAFLTAAGRASTLAATGLARVYDAAVERRLGPRGGAGPQVAYVISEWVDGRPLPAVLAEDGVLDPSAVARIGAAAADALDAAHRIGLAHGRLHPGNLLLGPRGQVRLTDTATSAALAGLVPGELTAAAVLADVRALTACLYAALTGRWPAAETEQPAGGIPLAPVSGGQTAAPRLVRASVPRALDAVLVRALGPARQGQPAAITTAAGLAAALAPLVAEADAREEAARRPVVARPPSLLRRAVPWVAAVAFVAGVGTATYVAGRSVGELPPPPGGLAVLTAPQASAKPGTSALVPFDLLAAGVTVRDYDPDGNQQENPSTVVNAYDQDPITAWTTSTYASAAFGGLKPGVGLLVDFGQPVAVRQVGLGFTTPGANVELRAGDALGANEQSLPVLTGKASVATAETLTVPTAVPHRFWLVWITQLPPDLGSRSQAGISAMVFSH